MDYAILGQALDEWFATDLGNAVLVQEQRQLRRIAQTLFGYYLLEVDVLCRRMDYLEACPIRVRARVSPCEEDADQVVALPEQLPVATDYIDAVVLPHTLDFAVDPRQVLREVERVLIPEGKVVITGFNPYSLWGLWRIMPGASRKLPWRGHFISFPQVQDWLSLLGFDVEDAYTLLYRPPWKRAFLMRRFAGLEKLGRRFWPWFAGAYIIVASKRVSTLTLVRLNWRLQRKLRKAAVEPVAHHSLNREKTHDG